MPSGKCQAGNANDDDIVEKQRVLAARADALYTQLIAAGHPIKFSKSMPNVRGVPPCDPSFFNSLHVLEDFFRCALLPRNNHSL